MIIQSPYDDIELAQTSLAEFVLAGAVRRGGKRAIIDGATGRVVSYGELAISVRRAAAGLAARGVAKGDVLALCSPNCPEFAVAYYAAVAAGAVVTTVNPLAPPGEIARQLLQSGARWLVTTAACRARRAPGGRRGPGARDLRLRHRRRRHRVRLRWPARVMPAGLPRSALTTLPSCRSPAAPPGCPRA